MNRKVIIWDNQNWCYIYHKNDMNGGFDDIYIYRSIMWRMIWHVYITSLTINTRQIWPSLQKKDICVSYWKLPGQEELETDQVFFLNTVQFARTFCFTWLTWFTPRGIHTIGGKPGIGHFGWDCVHSKMNNFNKMDNFTIQM